jgi:hypothetical protein
MDRGAGGGSVGCVGFWLRNSTSVVIVDGFRSASLFEPLSLDLYSAPLPSSHSKELGQSRWLVLYLTPFLSSLLILLFVCFFTYFYSSRLQITYVCLQSHFEWDRGIQITHPLPPHASKARKTRPPPLQSTDMTSQSGRSQILATWQEAFARLNANQPGITGLMTFTKVRSAPPSSRYHWFGRCVGMEVCEGVSVSYRYQQSGPKSVLCDISDQPSSTRITPADLNLIIFLKPPTKSEPRLKFWETQGGYLRFLRLSLVPFCSLGLMSEDG